MTESRNEATAGPQGIYIHQDVTLIRGEQNESGHRVSIASSNFAGELNYWSRTPQLVTNLRSSAKPFQLVPLIQEVHHTDEQIKFSSEEIALMTGSHSGTTEHVRVAAGILDKLGLKTDDLLCGRHPPFDKEARKAIGTNYTELHNNCSGKHAAMLALCKLKGYKIGSYLDPAHPVQRAIKRAIATICAVPEDSIPLGVDGCGVPVFYLSLTTMARGFARFVSEGELAQSNYSISPETRQEIVNAMVAHPEMVAGPKRLDTRLMNVANQDRPRLISKVGAEGLGAVALLEEKLGVIVKVEDGAGRAVGPALTETLYQMGILSEEEVSRLEDQHLPKIKNHRKQVVGRLVPEFKLQQQVGDDILGNP